MDRATTAETIETVLKPAAGLVLADILLRVGSNVMRGGVERAVLRNRYGKDLAKEIVGNMSMSRKLASMAVAKVAARSVPGAALVGTGMLVRLLYDRRKMRLATKGRTDAKPAGDKAG